jgi:CheY-like chemotaxis protein
MDANAHPPSLAASLLGRQILVAEDEFLIADELASVLEGAGAVVLGPFGRVHDALACIEQGTSIDSAILDIDLGGEAVFPVAMALRERGVPFVFATGAVGLGGMPKAFAHVPCWGKPFPASAIAATLPSLTRRTRI